MNHLPFTDHHITFRNTLREFLKSEVTPHVDQWENDHIVPREIWKRMGEEGFLCTAVSPGYGGMGGDFLYSVMVIEEIVQTNHTGLMAFLHSDIVVPYIESFGSDSQKFKYLPACVRGDMVTAIAMTEPDAGSDLTSMTTTAVEKNEEFLINGSKTFISNGINCDLIVLAARDPSIANPYQAISLYLIEDGTPGFIKGNRIDKMGMLSQDTAELFFTNCRIPKGNLLGAKGAGFVILMQKLQQERLLCAICAIAIAEIIMDWTKNWCRGEQKSASPVPLSQAAQFAFVEMETDLRIGRAFLNDLIMDHMDQKQVVMETSMAKFWTTDLVNRIANRCMEIIGCFAVHEACPIVRMWRDIRVFPIFAGTNEIMKGIIAKSMKL